MQVTSIRPNAARFVLGLGCERGTPAAEVIALAENALASIGASGEDIACIASLDNRADEPAIQAAALHFNVSSRFFAAPILEAETPRLRHPSDRVFALTGCHGVAEASALAGAGACADLVVPKIKSAHATAALARTGVASQDAVS
ncbi:cobalamin biosynthesis protein [Rhizobium sp. 32-5/1]|uniref:cobalamin biosynthesis protein n=1 Tax=Rhizobium sp. 32-5/1 TaxID=3019602 RepID=UPI00240E14D9|nr:cobalamin biosynthesis protein [Rhizobium sp. 32-5/1]WEZ83215.1 cobalamin biosynthesis protein [Rhizobium sp. 32-5/1]